MFASAVYFSLDFFAIVWTYHDLVKQLDPGPRGLLSRLGVRERRVGTSAVEYLQKSRQANGILILFLCLVASATFVYFAWLSLQKASVATTEADALSLRYFAAYAIMNVPLSWANLFALNHVWITSMRTAIVLSRDVVLDLARIANETPTPLQVRQHCAARREFELTSSGLIVLTSAESNLCSASGCRVT